MTASRERQIAASGLYMIPTIVGNLLPLVTLPVFTRVLDPRDYGAWALATAYAAFLTGLANFGLTLAYDRNFFEYRDGRDAAALLYSVLAFVTTAVLLCGVATWLWQAPIAAWLTGSSANGSLVFWIFAATGISSLKWYYLAYLRNHGDAKGYVWFTLDETVLSTAWSLLFVVWLHSGVIGLGWGQFLGAAIVFVAVTVRFLRRLRPAFSTRILREALKLGYPLTPRIFMGAIGSNVDKYFLGLLATLGSVGVYSIGQRVSYMVFAYMTALENVFAPETYRRMFDMGDQGGRSVGVYLTPFVYVSFAVALGVSLFSEEALAVLTTRPYHGAAPVVNVLTLYYAIMFFGKQPQLVYAKKTYLLSVLTVISLSVNAATTIVGVRLFGTIGAALGTLAGGIFGVTLYNGVARRYYRIEWETGKLAAMLTILAAASVAVLAMNALGISYAIQLAVKLAALGVFAALGVGLGILTRDNVRAGLTVLRRPFRHTTAASAQASP